MGSQGGNGGTATQKKLAQALVWVLEGDLERAEGALRELAHRDSEEALLYLALARVYRRRGEIGRAIQIHQNLLLRPLPAGERHQALRGLAEDFRSGGFLRRAEAAFQEVLAARPKDAAALTGLLRVVEDRGELRRAAEIGTQLAKQTGDRNAWMDAERWCAVARSDHEAGRESEARRALSRALRRDRDHGGAWLLLGQLEAERGKTRRALRAWRRAADCDPESAAAAYPKLEATYAALGRSRDTERLLRRALERDPRDLHARLALTRLLAARGDTREAIELLDKGETGEDAPIALALQRARLLLDDDDADLRAGVEALLARLEREFGP